MKEWPGQPELAVLRVWAAVVCLGGGPTDRNASVGAQLPDPASARDIKAAACEQPRRPVCVGGSGCARVRDANVRRRPRVVPIASTCARRVDIEDNGIMPQSLASRELFGLFVVASPCVAIGAAQATVSAHHEGPAPTTGDRRGQLHRRRPWHRQKSRDLGRARCACARARRPGTA